MTRRRGAVLLLLLALAAAGTLATARRVAPIPDHDFFAAERPLVIAHRGGMGEWPENTLFAFRRAFEEGADVVEMDLRVGGDGTLVALHDETLERTSDGRGALSELGRGELRALDAGYHWSRDGGKTHPFRGRGIRVPIFEEVLRALPGARLNLEIKGFSESHSRDLCSLLRRAGAGERVLVASFRQAGMDAFRDACPEVATSATFREAWGFYLRNRLGLAGLFRPVSQALQVPERLGRLGVISRGFVVGARRLNLRVHAWVANESADLRRLLALGVDGILTDYPGRLVALLDEADPSRPD